MAGIYPNRQQPVKKCRISSLIERYEALFIRALTTLKDKHVILLDLAPGNSQSLSFHALLRQCKPISRRNRLSQT